MAGLYKETEDEIQNRLALINPNRCVPFFMNKKSLGIIKRKKLFTDTVPVNKKYLTGTAVGACAHVRVLAWKSWSNRTNSRPEACDTGAPGAGAKLLAPRKRKRESERSE